ncbi:methyltransferase (TIGR00027 family) [Oxalobacteraceae bacterium GrIS 1.11]
MQNPSKQAEALPHSDEAEQLLASMQAAMDQGLAAATGLAQDLAWRWMRLLGQTAVPELHPALYRWLLESFAGARATLFAKYLSASELELVRSRMLAHAADWLPLVTEVRRQIDAGTGFAEPAAQEMAQRWQELYRASYAGDDAKLEGKIALAFEREPDLFLGTDSAAMSFMHRALLHLHSQRAAPRDAGPKPSALMVAVLRAAHQLLDAPLVFEDPLALAILGPDEEAAVRADPGQYANPMSKALRTSLVVRGRLAEDEWARASQNGCVQYVILGAGLDTYAYRDEGRSSKARIFEVDLPATQLWKRAALRTAGIDEPATLTYVPVDFGRQTLAGALAASGFRADQPAFFSWLGVTLYLEPEDVLGTLRYIVSCAKGSAVVFDYAVAPALLSPMQRMALEMVAAKTAASGEPWKSNFEPDALSATLEGLGFGMVDNFSADQMTARYLGGRDDGLHMGGVTRLVHATV